MLNIMDMLCGIPSFLNDSTISCIGDVDESITTEVKHTIKRDSNITAQFSPVSVIFIQLIPLAHIIFPECMNGWNIIIAPPNGNSSANLENEDLNDSVAKYNMINRNISSIICVKSWSDITANIIIAMKNINLILPSKSCIILFFELNVSKSRASLIFGIIYNFLQYF